MASTQDLCYNSQDYQLHTLFRDCDVQDAYEETPSENPTCTASVVPSAPSRHCHRVLRVHLDDSRRSRSCFPRIASQNGYAYAREWKRGAEDIDGERLSAKQPGLAKATSYKQVSQAGTTETVVIVEDVDSSSDEESTLDFSHHQAGLQRKQGTVEGVSDLWQRGRPLIRPAFAHRLDLSTSFTCEGAISPLSLDSRPSSAAARGSAPSAVAGVYRNSVDQGMFVLHLALRQQASRHRQGGSELIRHHLLGFPCSLHSGKSGHMALSIPMQREEDLSAGSGTLVDEDEANYRCPRNRWKLSGVEDTDTSFRREETVTTRVAPLIPLPERLAHRSCSNTRRTERVGRSGAKAHSHSRHPLARYKPISHSQHLRKHVAPAETPCAPFDVYTAGIKELLDGLSQGHLTSVTILETYLRQIDRHNDTLRAIVHLAPRDQIYRLARQRDVERSLGRIRGELHGIPIIVK